MKENQIRLPNQVIIAWVLNNLTGDYESFISTITQSYRSNPANINLETLFSNLLDKARRIKSIDSAYFTKPQRTKPNSPRAAGIKNTSRIKKYCNKCKASTHQTKDCYHLFPNKAPDWWKEKFLINASLKRQPVDDNVFLIREPPVDLEEKEN